MTSSDAFDPDDLIADGLTNFVAITKDQSDVQMGAALYRTVAEVFRQNLQPGEACALAFPSMIIRPNVRTECFVAVTSSRLIVAWTKGTFRKKTESEVVLLNAITDAKWEVGTASGTRGATLMHVEAGADRRLTFALPADRAADVGNAIQSALLSSHSD